MPNTTRTQPGRSQEVSRGNWVTLRYEQLLKLARAEMSRWASRIGLTTERQALNKAAEMSPEKQAADMTAKPAAQRQSPGQPSEYVEPSAAENRVMDFIPSAGIRFGLPAARVPGRFGYGQRPNGRPNGRPNRRP